jgi:hypothetical protein
VNVLFVHLLTCIQIDSKYILIKQELDQDQLERIFEHTRMLKERTMKKRRTMMKEPLASDSKTKSPSEDHSGNDVPRQSDWQTRSHGFNGSNIDVELGLDNNRIANRSSVPRLRRRSSLEAEEYITEDKACEEIERQAELIYRQDPFKYLQGLHRTNILAARARLYGFWGKTVVIDYEATDLHDNLKLYSEFPRNLPLEA